MKLSAFGHSKTSRLSYHTGWFWYQISTLSRHEIRYTIHCSGSPYIHFRLRDAHEGKAGVGAFCAAD